MATLAQLEAEPWWDREIVTPELRWLGDELCRRTGRSGDAAGSKGDRYHLRGAHRSQEWIKRSAFCTNRTYTLQGGLTLQQERQIAGFDFTPGSAQEMVAQCRRLDAAIRGGRLEEIREFYGNVDGDQVVDGWDNVDNSPATSDSSHLWHWHLSIDRRHLTNKPLMERILAIALGEDDDMTPQDLLETRIGSPALGTFTVADLLKKSENARREVVAANAALATVGAKLDVLIEAVASLPDLNPASIEAKLDQIDRRAAERDAALTAEVNEVAGETVEVLGAVDCRCRSHLSTPPEC